VDLTGVSWEKGRYVVSELTNIYTANDRRVGEIISALNKYTKDISQVRALGFCASIEHATYMTEKFLLAGLRADCLTSANTHNRALMRQRLMNKEINYLFVVDIFNEGVDIPEIDTVLFLRPTESLTIFLQQLGRGLRLAEDKESLTVLDFVGNARPEYSFESKFRALIGKTATAVYKEVEEDFPHLPLGCSVVLEKKAKETILNNIKAATALHTNQLIRQIKSFRHHSILPLTLKNFLDFYDIPIQLIYKRGSWKRLCHRAEAVAAFDERHEKEIVGAIRRWLTVGSASYFQFILRLAHNGFVISFDHLSEVEKKMLVMLYYDVWQSAARFESLDASIRAIGENEVLVQEIIEVLEILVDRVDFKEFDIDLPYHQPLKIHARYTRDQILAAFGFSTFEKKSSNREGVAFSSRLNTELLFINLTKSEENFSPTTMYDDFAINEYLFHWQSQNSTSPETPKGLSYIKHQENQKRILLFIREKAEDAFGATMGFVFVGEGIFVKAEGEKPMNIQWRLTTPLPHYLWKDAAKLRIG
jgi:hypothetical protein